MLKPPSFDGGFSAYIRKNKPSKAIIIMSPFSYWDTEQQTIKEKTNAEIGIDWRPLRR